MSESVEEFAARIVARLLRDGHEIVTLDDIGEAIGVDLASPDRIEAIFGALEARSIEIRASESSSLPELLHRVLGAARSLRQKGLASTPAAIAQELQISSREVRVALLYAEVLSRP
jgi:hypothetical protein